MTAHIQNVDEEFGEEFGVKFGVNEKKVLLLLSYNPTISTTEIAEKTNLSKRGVEKQIKKFRDLGVVTRKGLASTIHQSIWSVSSATFSTANNGTYATATSISIQRKNGAYNRISPHPNKYPTSTPQAPIKYPSSTHQVHDLLHTDNPNIEKMVQVIGEQELSVKEIMNAIGLKDRVNFMNLFLTPSVSERFIRMLYPQSPRHPRQKYLLTAKGLALYHELHNNGAL